MLFLFTTKGVLCGDTAFKSELSDLFHVRVKQHNDPQALMVFILQFATGKTNHGVKLYGRVGRHVDVEMGPVGVTKEMDNPSIDFFDNSMWFNIKFITDICCCDQTKFLVNKTYSNPIEQTCTTVLGISTTSQLYIGCKLGLFESEINKDNPDNLQNIGNYDLKIQEKKHYLTKIPMTIICSKAGFMKGNHMN